MYDRIMVPTDGSECSKSAMAHAESLAEKYDAELHIVYVADVRAGMSQPSIDLMVQRLEEFGVETVEDVKDNVSEDINAVTEVIHGIPHSSTNDYVDNHDIDLIVMGTHGRSGLDRLLIGSVTEKVIRTTSVPVMTVPGED